MKLYVISYIVYKVNYRMVLGSPVITPVVHADVGTGQTLMVMFGPSLEPVFRCQFEALSGNYSYDVSWFINDDEVVNFPNTTYVDIEATQLKPIHWTGTYKLNMLVRNKKFALKIIVSFSIYFI